MVRRTPSTTHHGTAFLLLRTAFPVCKMSVHVTILSTALKSTHLTYNTVPVIEPIDYFCVAQLCPMTQASQTDSSLSWRGEIRQPNLMFLHIMYAKAHNSQNYIQNRPTMASALSVNTKENSLSAEAAAEYERYMRRTKMEQAMNKLLRRLFHCAGLIVAPCLLLGLLSLMGRYPNSNPRVRRSLGMPELISQEEPTCRHNAVAYMVRKEQAGSYGNLVRSLDLLYENYLNEFHEDTHVFLFHLGDFDTEDLQQFEWRFPDAARGTIQLVNLADTHYWQLPANLQDEDPGRWKGTQDMEKLHENRFWSIKVWQYFDEMNHVNGCNYRHVMRMHQDSFIYSPIKYNLFEFAQTNNYHYGYRLCTYEMGSAEFLWDEYLRDTVVKPKHDWSPDDCAFYNPFFVADIQFFLSRRVQRFLSFVDKGGYVYRDAIAASVLHSMIVYAYASTQTIHRFLDFTYEHFERQQEDGCPTWGAMQLGYNDIQGIQHMEEWTHVYLTKRKCKIGEDATQLHTLRWADLSPTYSHVPHEVELSLQSATSGLVDLPNQGVRSG